MPTHGLDDTEKVILQLNSNLVESLKILSERDGKDLNAFIRDLLFEFVTLEYTKDTPPISEEPQ